MTAAEARRLLVAQHDQLREQMSNVWILARAASLGTKLPELRHRFAALKVAFDDHDAAEAELIKPILKSLGLTGRRQSEYLTQHYAEMHSILSRALEQASWPELTQIERARAMLVVICQLREHMAQEEQELLSDVFRDQFIADGEAG